MAMGGGIILTIFAVAIALVLAIRLAPSDPAVWHIAVADGSVATDGNCAEHIRVQTGGARATCLLPGDPVQVLTKLSAVALAYPRTTLLAGSPAEGRMTWVSRSRIMGFPDYITAQAAQTPQGTRLDVYARLRFGGSDLGVNAARLTTWLQQM